MLVCNQVFTYAMDRGIGEEYVPLPKKLPLKKYGHSSSDSDKDRRSAAKRKERRPRVISSPLEDDPNTRPPARKGLDRRPESPAIAGLTSERITARSTTQAVSDTEGPFYRQCQTCRTAFGIALNFCDLPSSQEHALRENFDRFKISSASAGAYQLTNDTDSLDFRLKAAPAAARHVSAILDHLDSLLDWVRSYNPFAVPESAQHSDDEGGEVTILDFEQQMAAGSWTISDSDDDDFDNEIVKREVVESRSARPASCGLGWLSSDSELIATLNSVTFVVDQLFNLPIPDAISVTPYLDTHQMPTDLQLLHGMNDTAILIPNASLKLQRRLTLINFARREDLRQLRAGNSMENWLPPRDSQASERTSMSKKILRSVEDPPALHQTAPLVPGSDSESEDELQEGSMSSDLQLPPRPLTISGEAKVEFSCPYCARLVNISSEKAWR